MSIPDDGIRELAKKTAKSIVDHGSIPMATLKESIILKDKVDELLAKEIEFPEVEPFPEFPDYPTEISVTNLPEVQKVEIINHKKDKDDKEQLQLLKQIADELKKKEEYAYDIEIDSTLKEQLKGDKGEDGKDGVDGNKIEPKEIVEKLESLDGDERLDVSAVRGTEALIEDIAKKIAKEEVKKVKKTTVISGSGSSSSSSGGGIDWTYYATTWTAEPTLNASITGGDVYDYTLDGVTRYRFVPTTYDATQDAFYTSFSNPTLSGLIVARG